MAKADLPSVHYTPDAELKNPRELLRRMSRDLMAARQLAWRLFVRDLSAQFRQTVLRYVWAVLPPLFTSSVFILLNGANLLTVGGTGMPYPVYVITGTVFFSVFVDALNSPVRQVIGSTSILVKIRFPREALVLTGLAHVVFNFSIKLLLLGAVLVLFGIPVQPTSFLVVIPLLGLVVLGTLIGMFLVPFAMLFHDVAYVISLAGSSLMFLSPVVYTPPKEGLLSMIVAFNPLTPLIMAARDFILLGSSPYAESVFLTVTIGMVLLFVAWVFYHVTVPVLIERLGS